MGLPYLNHSVKQKKLFYLSNGPRDIDVAPLFHQHLAGQTIHVVDGHRIGSADAVGTGAAESQGTVVVPLDLMQRIQKAVGRLYLNLVFLPIRSWVWAGSK